MNHRAPPRVRKGAHASGAWATGQRGCDDRERVPDRHDAGLALADVVASHVTGLATVLAIPRGGLVVALPVAEALAAPIDVVIPRKLGAPGTPSSRSARSHRACVSCTSERSGSSACGPTTSSGGRAPGGGDRRREAAYRGGRSPAPVAGRTVVIVDDGVATGATAVAALRWARAAGAARVVFAAPVGPPAARARLEPEADDVILLRGAARVPRRGGVVPRVRSGLRRRGDRAAPGSGPERGGAGRRRGVRAPRDPLAVHWLRRPLESDARRERLFALFVVSRAGLWFALMGLFLLYASVDTQGRAFAEDAGEFAWYFIVLVVPARCSSSRCSSWGGPRRRRPRTKIEPPEQQRVERDDDRGQAHRQRAGGGRQDEAPGRNTPAASGIASAL